MKILLKQLSAAKRYSLVSSHESIIIAVGQWETIIYCWEIVISCYSPFKRPLLAHIWAPSSFTLFFSNLHHKSTVQEHSNAALGHALRVFIIYTYTYQLHVQTQPALCNCIPTIYLRVEWLVSEDSSSERASNSKTLLHCPSSWKGF